MKKTIALLVLVLAVMAVLPAAAQDDMMGEPEVRVKDQFVTDGTVTVEFVNSPGVGWMVIHADNGDGAPGPVIGWRHLHPGQNNDIRVSIDVFAATPRLFAMLHADTDGPGYEFGMVEGADPPVFVDGAPVTPGFDIHLVQASPQFIDDGTFLVDVAIMQEPGFLVIHADADGRPGPVIGTIALFAGQNSIVAPFLDDTAPTAVWPMLHVDTGVEGEYEFGTVEGADGPVVIDGRVATFRVDTAPTIVANPQIVQNGDNVPANAMMMGMDDMMDEMGDAMDDAMDEMDDAMDDAMDEMDDAMDEMGDAMDEMGDAMDEMGDAMDEMGDAMDDASDAMDDAMDDMGDAMGTMPTGVTVFVADAVLSDGPGWLVVHADGGGQPGPVIGSAPVNDGLNRLVEVLLDPAGVTPILYPMLHTDDGVAGEYEFPDADGPVRVNDRVVTFPVPAAPDWSGNPQPIGAPILLDTVVTDATSWVVIHASVDNAPGPVLGFKQVSSGLSRNVLVDYDDPATVDGAASDEVFVMLHYDTGMVGAYEFPGEDGPIMVNGNVVVRPLGLVAE